MLLNPRLMTLLAGGLLASGCSGLAPQLLIEDNEIANEGSRMATLDTCVARGLASAAVVADYRAAQAQLLSVSVHNRDLFERRYVATKVALASRSERSVTKTCRRIDSELPLATRAMAHKFARIGGQPAATLVGLTQTPPAAQPKGI